MKTRMTPKFSSTSLAPAVNWSESEGPETTTFWAWAASGSAAICSICWEARRASRTVSSTELIFHSSRRKAAGPRLSQSVAGSASCKTPTTVSATIDRTTRSAAAGSGIRRRLSWLTIGSRRNDSSRARRIGSRSVRK